MEEKLIKNIDLENGLQLKLYDASRKLAGDRWLVSKREKIFIDEREKDNVMKEIQDSFLSSSLSYFSHSDFPQKYVLKKFNEKIKKDSWCKNI
ncbi:MAG: hypothetical protein JRG74_11045 [Deltaproteobacteria bacterium]|nr:hypothetical protein [Deltaproteobacteria bacterium]